MSSNSSTFSRKIAILLMSPALLLALTWFVLPVKGQSRAFPRVGTIKDYPATGLMTGCGNLYFYKASNARSTNADYVFLSRGDGSHAWMNLNGRDVLLRQIKSTARRGQKVRPYYYCYGKVRITIVTEPFKPDEAMGEADPMYKMKIILQTGSTVRIVHAVGDADC